jgi:phosphoribosyl 1,2-cyclic phosphate phosphodiesterase
LKVIFLGTGTSQGVPVIACSCAVCQSIDYRDKRLRSSIYIEQDETAVVIDTGPDFRQQMLVNRIQKVDAIVFTHEHKDHTAGLDDIRAFNFKSKKDMPVYATDRVAAQLRQEYAYIFADYKYPGIPRVEIVPITNQAFQVGSLQFQPIEVLHYKLPVFGYRIGSFVYITDANYIGETEKNMAKGAEVLVLNALQKEPHISHFTLDEAIEMATELGAKKTYFTHISHKLGRHMDIERELPKGMALAYDGLEISIED